MPQRNTSRRLIVRLVLFSLAGWLVWALGRNTAQSGIGELESASTALPEGTEPTRTRGKQSGFSKRRLATTLAFTTLFFAGAAFSAGAGDVVVGALEGSTSCTAEAESAEPVADESCDPAATEEQPTDEAALAEEDPSGEASEPAPEPAPSEDDQSGEAAGDDSGVPADEDPADDQSADDGDDAAQPGDDGSADSGEVVSDPADGDDASGDDEWGEDPSSDEPEAGPGSPAHAGDDASAEDGDNEVGLTGAEGADPALEFDGAGYGVVWLHRTLPDPTPPAKRLDPRFAKLLVRTSQSEHVDWALVLGVVRANGHRGTWPASARSVDRLASRLSALKANADEWRAVLALVGRTSFADRVIALTRYNRAVGLRALVRGLEAEKAHLEQRVLSDSRLSIYAAGRDDLANHRINVRVLVLMLYLAEAHGQVTVSSLNSGHRLYSRPGVVSAHKYGLAVDVAGLEGQSIVGNQQVGGLTERAVRNILLLPVELRPKQVISLLGLGGPSFPLADHYDHIHIGY
jgi:hypothetical protein